MESAGLLDRAGRRRSQATLSSFHQGRAPRNKALRYPPDPPPVEEIIAVMRAAGDGPEAMRLRGLIIVLWRAGLRISEALALGDTDLDRQRGAVLVGAGKRGRRPSNTAPATRRRCESATLRPRDRNAIVTPALARSHVRDCDNDVSRAERGPPHVMAIEVDTDACSPRPDEPGRTAPVRRWLGRHRALGVALAVCLVLVGVGLVGVGLASSTTSNGAPAPPMFPSQGDGSQAGGGAGASSGGEASPRTITPVGLITAATGLLSAIVGFITALVALRTSLKTAALAQAPGKDDRAGAI